jgi:hypothetical protein
MTGFAPYFLLYECNPLLLFDIADHTWETLNWDEVVMMEDLITIRTLQISHWDTILAAAITQQKCEHQHAVYNFNKMHDKYFVNNDFDVGMWILLHKTWLDN